MDQLKRDYSWIEAPLVACGPMRLIALAPLATEVSKAGGLGFVGAGSDASKLDSILGEVRKLSAEDKRLSQVQDVLPVGVGFLLWAGDKLLRDALPSIEKYCPAAIWLFAPNHTDDLSKWTTEVRRVTSNKTKLWIQVGTVANALEVTRSCHPDVLIVQGQDAGGHGLHKAAGIIPLFPEVDDAITDLCQTSSIPKPVLVAAGGILDPRTAAAALTLGASGLVMGTRYLATPEAQIAAGYRDAVLAAADGGQHTERTKLYDQLRGTTDWPAAYGGRGVLNESFHDAQKGVEFWELKRLHDEALGTGDAGWGHGGGVARLTTYAGTGVGLVGKVMGAGEVTVEVREGARRVVREAGARLSRLPAMLCHSGLFSFLASALVSQSRTLQSRRSAGSSDWTPPPTRILKVNTRSKLHIAPAGIASEPNPSREPGAGGIALSESLR
ncbi:uncharacterized protein LTR77_010158 [Saxophila tyrrhenica]|uniref:Nitronate monooxygenase domain-containing protein n=1 Tax=Saxophila tyrrhenica TaxID=1690608 RepID=A0AAV9NYT9_9PEZI|nr:hypothetical protein LTR77_010158 [Saxophila tyrrhenica]